MYERLGRQVGVASIIDVVGASFLVHSSQQYRVTLRVTHIFHSLASTE